MNFLDVASLHWMGRQYFKQQALPVHNEHAPLGDHRAPVRSGLWLDAPISGPSDRGR